MSDWQWWLVWAVLAVHLAWSALNLWAHLEARRIRREAEDMLRERRMLQQWHEVKWGER